MFKDVVVCNQCEYFFINQDGSTMCTNKRGIPFPSAVDYCSYGKLSESERTIDNTELLKLVYEQRRS